MVSIMNSNLITLGPIPNISIDDKVFWTFRTLIFGEMNDSIKIISKMLLKAYS